MTKKPWDRPYTQRQLELMWLWRTGMLKDDDGSPLTVWNARDLMWYLRHQGELGDPVDQAAQTRARDIWYMDHPGEPSDPADQPAQTHGDGLGPWWWAANYRPRFGASLNPWGARPSFVGLVTPEDDEEYENDPWGYANRMILSAAELAADFHERNKDTLAGEELYRAEREWRETTYLEDLVMGDIFETEAEARLTLMELARLNPLLAMHQHSITWERDLIHGLKRSARQRRYRQKRAAITH